MPATVFLPATFGLIVLAIGLWTYRRDLFAFDATGDTRLRSLGPVFIASAIATFSGEHLSAVHDLAQMVPKWFPLPIPTTYVVGVCLLAAGVSIATKRGVEWSAPLLGLLFALFVLLIYAPSAARHPRLHLVWIFPFREGTFAVAGFSLFVFATRPAWSDGFARFARFWAAFVIAFYGVLHLLYPAFAPGVPSEVKTAAWVPFPQAVAYVTGVILVVLGMAASFRKTAVPAITSAGALMTVATVVLYVPNLFLATGPAQEITAINFVADTLLFAGAMFAIATAVGAGRGGGALTDSTRPLRFKGKSFELQSQFSGE
ncbi:MAG TPA: hypothetical protein VGQ44_03685 [Gemmatimonadaceae bacterium]|jgi:uncharacterized membrane protein|nr:hypothetical protein [Gemmatimonadaceae bacterium]